MPQFLVIAYDADDKGAEQRRLAARPAHLDSIRPLIENGAIVCAGAILDEGGNVIGSALNMDMPSRAALDAWIAQEPFKRQGVWERIEVTPMRIVVRDGKLLT